MALAAARPVVTCELNPPKGIDCGALLARAEALQPVVHAFNLTESHAARMSMSPLGAARLMVERGLEPTLQMTTRDRNRLALQGDLLAAAALGVENVVVMGGDPPSAGDHPDAKPVFDLYASGVLAAAAALQEGHDLAGNPLVGPSPRFCIGAVVNPGADDLEGEVRRMAEKRAAGATFFQTQAVYDAEAFARFMALARDVDAPVLAGILPPASAAMARHMNANVPGIHVPPAIIDALERAGDDRREIAIEIAARLAREVVPLCRGVHLMTVGREDTVPEILRRAGVTT